MARQASDQIRLPAKIFDGRDSLYPARAADV
jgi:hypothetical protein